MFFTLKFNDACIVETDLFGSTKHHKVQNLYLINVNQVNWNLFRFCQRMKVLAKQTYLPSYCEDWIVSVVTENNMFPLKCNVSFTHLMYSNPECVYALALCLFMGILNIFIHLNYQVSKLHCDSHCTNIWIKTSKEGKVLTHVCPYWSRFSKGYLDSPSRVMDRLKLLSSLLVSLPIKGLQWVVVKS